MHIPTRKDFNVDENTKLKEWLQEIPDHFKSRKHIYFILSLH